MCKYLLAYNEQYPCASLCTLVGPIILTKEINEYLVLPCLFMVP